MTSPTVPAERELELAGSIPARLHSGVAPLARNVELALRADELVIRAGEALTRVALAALHVSPRIARAPRFVALPDGQQLECADAPWLDRLPRRNRLEAMLHELERRSWFALVATAATAAFVAFLWLDGLDRAAGSLAEGIGDEREAGWGAAMLGSLEKSALAPSKLPEARQLAIRQRFRRALAALELRDHELHLRASEEFGANAFALPGKHIVITDALVLRLNDDEVIAVLAHELGHSVLQHTGRKALRSYANAALTSFAKGQLTDVVLDAHAEAARTLVDRGYRRELEHDADGFALAAACKLGLSPSAFATALERGARRDGDEPEPWSWLQTHPSISARAARARAWVCGSPDR